MRQDSENQRVRRTPGRRTCIGEERTQFNHCCPVCNRMETGYIPPFFTAVMLVAMVTEMVAQENGDRISRLFPILVLATKIICYMNLKS